MNTPTTVYIGLGSNLGDSLLTLRSALSEIAIIDGVELLRVSSFYVSKPLAGMDQPDYLNAVAEIACTLAPRDLLMQLQQIEAAHGRERKAHWAARTLDLDILLFGDLVSKDERLTLPHPGIPERDFVLVPLHELEPSLQIPGLGQVDDLLAHCEIRGLQPITENSV